MVSRELPRWIAPLGVAAVLAVATLLRFWALDRPGTLVFDELYYVRDAISQLAHGYPTTWPNDDPSLTHGFTDEASYAVHPPLGKWIIGLGLLVFGDGTGWGWRSAIALSGVATVALTMRLGWRISRSISVALLAGLMLAIDGVHVVLTRVGLLDGILTFFIVLGALFAWRDVEWRRARDFRPVWARPWLFAAALAFGAAAAVKWSGLYPLASVLLFFAAHDLARRIRRARLAPGPGSAATLGSAPAQGSAPRQQTAAAWGASLWRAFASGVIALPAAFAVYLTSWTGWIITTGGWGRDGTSWWAGLAKYHADMFAWHSTLTASHPYQSNPLTWPLAIRPTAMYLESPGPGLSAVVSPLPNPIVTLAGVLALLVLAWWIVRPLTPSRRLLAPGRTLRGARFAAAFVLTCYLSGWLPWVLTVSRSAVFQFYAVVLTPFAAIALALVLDSISSPRGPARSGDELAGRRAAVAVFVIVAVVLAVLFFPVWSGMPIPDWFARWHNWIPSWG